MSVRSFCLSTAEQGLCPMFTHSDIDRKPQQPLPQGQNCKHSPKLPFPYGCQHLCLGKRSVRESHPKE